MEYSDYADSAQARESDLLHQRYKSSPRDELALEKFFAECNARREAESIASRARVKAAVDGIGIILGYVK